jgi:Zn-dependent peptidase ImmA (M78 family)
MRTVAKPEMIVLARLSRGRTAAELAAAMKVSPGYLSKVEHGLIPASDTLIAELARHLSYPITFFYRPEHVQGSDSLCFHHRKRKSMSAKLLTTIEAQMYVTQLQVRRLLDDLEIEAPNKFYTLDPDDYGSDASTTARVLRSLWRLPNGPIPDLIRVIEAAGGVVVLRDFGSLKLDGMSCWPKGSPPLFFVNSAIAVDRMRMTLAHELGHLVMHASPPSADPEVEAQTFALEFLAPAADIESDLHDLRIAKLPGLKEYWRLSMSALVMAARQSGALSDHRVRSLYVQLSQHGYRTSEPFPLSPEQPTILTEAIRIHLDEHGYAVDELAHIADLHPDEFRDLYLPDDPDFEQGRLPLRVLS